MPFTIFISHRTEDVDLANRIAGLLTSLSDREVQCLVAEGMPGSRDWFQWISENSQSSDLLLFLYTASSSDHDWSWCVMEIGWYQGAKQQQSRDAKIAYFVPGTLLPPAFLSKYQFYDTSRTGVKKFFEDLFLEGEYSEKKPLKKDLHITKANEYQNAIDDLVRLFARITRREEYFYRRLRLVFQLNEDLSIDQIRLDKISPREGALTLLKTAKLDARPSTLSFLGLEQEGSWDELYGKQRAQDNSEWLDRLVNYVAASMPNASSDDYNSRYQILSPLVSANASYLPVVALLEFISGWPAAVAIIFVKTPPLSDDPSVMIRQGIPEAVAHLAILGRLSRRLRWTFIEPLLRKASMLESGAPDHDWFWRDFESAIDQRKVILDDIEQQGNRPEYTSPANIAFETGIDQHKLPKTLWTRHVERRDRIFSCVSVRDAEAIQNTLSEWLAETKMFLSAIEDKMKELIET